MKKRMSKAQRISMLEDRVSDLEAQQEHFYDGLRERLERLEKRAEGAPERKGVPIHQVMDEWINGEEQA